MRKEDYDLYYPKEEYYCDHCEDYTDHWVIQACDHERDSSMEQLKCCKCGWRYFGASGDYYEDHD